MADMSAYELLRQANIARNRKVMDGLGLGDKHASPLSRRQHGGGGHGGGGSGGSGASRKRRAEAAEVVANAQTKGSRAEPPQPSRRSSRTLGLPLPNYKEANDFRESKSGRGGGGGGGDDDEYNHTADAANEEGVEEDAAEEGSSAAGGRSARAKETKKVKTVLAKEEASSGCVKVKEEAGTGHALSWFRKTQSSEAKSQPPPEADTSRAMRCAVGRVLRDHLGFAMPSGHTKASVMATLSATSMPRFSKYSGVVEWANAVVLWVNVGGSDYANSFTEGGRVMAWFAGSKHDPDSPAIVRLMRTAMTCKDTSAVSAAGSGAAIVKKEEDEEEEDDDSDVAKGKSDDKAGKRKSDGGIDPVLLMCRVQPGPYVLCGRVSVRLDPSTGLPTGHDPQRRPLRFELTLLDYDAMARAGPRPAAGAAGAKGPQAHQPQAHQPDTWQPQGGGSEEGDEVATFAAVLKVAKAKS